MQKLLNNINKPVKSFRAETAKGFLASDDRVQEAGGEFGFGVIKQYAVITRGEALGHGFWIDDKFVEDVQFALSAEEKGLKSRYTHPGMSSDGLSKRLGRTIGGSSKDGVVYADLHFAKSSTTSPDGDLRKHVIDLAKEDPESFGSSIVFQHDIEAFVEFSIKHGAELRDGPWGEYLDFEKFESPDELNENNLPPCNVGRITGCGHC